MTITKTQQNRLQLLDSLPKGGTCCEAGVLAGDFSAEILKRCNPEKLYLVDLFRGSVMSGDENGEHMSRYDMVAMKEEVERRFAFEYVVEVVQAESVAWLTMREAGSLSWVYIDTTHQFEQTIGELAAALVAVKDGGFICGHDYDQQYPGVVQAVDHFCAHYGFSVEIFEGDRLASYKIFKTKVELS
jgi:hypothetical protein